MFASTSVSRCARTSNFGQLAIVRIEQPSPVDIALIRWRQIDTMERFRVKAVAESHVLAGQLDGRPAGATLSVRIEGRRISQTQETPYMYIYCVFWV